MTRRDRLTPDLFDVPHAAPPIPASMDYRPVVTALVGELLDHAHRIGKDRYAVAAEMSRLAGKEVSKYMLDAYSAPSREEFNAPAWLMPLLEVACETYAYTAWLAGVRGAQLAIGRDALAAELGRVRQERDELAEREHELRDRLRRMR